MRNPSAHHHDRSGLFTQHLLSLADVLLPPSAPEWPVQSLSIRPLIPTCQARLESPVPFVIAEGEGANPAARWALHPPAPDMRLWDANYGVSESNAWHCRSSLCLYWLVKHVLNFRYRHPTFPPVAHILVRCLPTVWAKPSPFMYLASTPALPRTGFPRTIRNQVQTACALY